MAMQTSHDLGKILRCSRHVLHHPDMQRSWRRTYVCTQILQIQRADIGHQFLRTCRNRNLQSPANVCLQPKNEFHSYAQTCTHTATLAWIHRSHSSRSKMTAWLPCTPPVRYMHPTGPGQERIMNVFDRRAKRMQKDRVALAEDAHLYDYLKDEVAIRVTDRLKDITKKFDVALDLGCGRGHIEKHISKKVVKKLFMADMSRNMLESAGVAKGIDCIKVHADEEFLPFRDDSLDLVLSSLSLHWVNDLPGAFRQILRALRNDGVFIGSIFGGDTLYELRCSLQVAEQEQEGGFAPHISPFTDMQDLGNLMTRAGFSMLTIDIDEVTVNYPSMTELMQDLKGMGESNASWSRKNILRRKTQSAAAAIYKDMYGNEDGSVPATFQILYMIGWKPDESQPKPAQRGSATASLKDLGKVPKPTT